MNEYKILWLAIMAFQFCLISALFYGLGGRANKWLRRYAGSAVFTLGVNLVAAGLGKWTPWLLLTWPVTAGLWTLGYGGDDPEKRVYKRCLIAAVSLMFGVLVGLLLGAPEHALKVAACIHMALGLITVVFAVENPFPAAFEEPLICMMQTIPLMGYLFL